MITREQLQEALEEQKKSSEPLGKVIVRKGWLKEEDIINILKGMLVVVFELAGEMFGMEIVYTREILNYRKITPLPNMPPYLMGMINIRDNVIPVVSLNESIFRKKDAVSEDTKILIIENGAHAVGVLVDRILSVRNYMSENFEDMARNIITAEKKYISGIIKDRGEIITLIKTEYLFTGMGHAGKK